MRYLLLFIWLFLWGGVQSAQALSVAGPDAWFRWEVKLDPETLPEGLEVVTFEEDGGGYNSELFVHQLGFRNSTQQPIILMRKLQDGVSLAEEDRPVPEGFYPEYRLVNNTLADWSQYDSVKVENGTQSVYLKEPKFIVRDYEGDSLKLRYYTWHDLGIELPNTNEDNRPLVVTIPPALPITIYAFHKGKIVEITGEIRYSLNTNYNPTQGAAGLAAVRAWDEKYGGTKTVPEILPKHLDVVPFSISFRGYAHLLSRIYEIIDASLAW